jgi:site-specific DNA-methyltransferase (adenine-specific)
MSAIRREVVIGDCTLYLGDCLDVLPALATGSADMVLCDPPYGTTQCKWDAVVPFAPMWMQLRRILKRNGAAVFMAAQPYTSALVMSNPAMFRYDWVWRKPKGTGHLNAKRMPMRDKEDVVVFYADQPCYNPQFGSGAAYGNKAGRSVENGLSDNYGKFGTHREGSDGRRYPKQVIDFGVVERGTVHPTQKPVGLMEYFILTYTNPGDTVLDFTMGSGTTGVACLNTRRRFVGIEKEPEYFDIACSRMSAPAPASDFFVTPPKREEPKQEAML